MPTQDTGVDGTPNPTATGGASSGQGGAESSGGGAQCESPAPAGCPCVDAEDCALGTTCNAQVCTPATCGDRRVDRGEICDDGNPVDDDGCDNNCQPSGGAAQLAAGLAHTCARAHDGKVKCWGAGADGRLGQPGVEAIGLRDVPADFDALALGGPAVDMCAGDLFTCAAFGTGKVRCWGDGALGKLGTAATDDVGFDQAPTGVEPIEIGGTVVALACGAEHACALLQDGGTVRCWGRFESGRLGSMVDQNIGDDEHPNTFPVVQVGGVVVEITAGDEHTCARLQDGTVRCWGRAQKGRLGNGTSTPDVGDDETPDGASNFVALPATVQLAAGGAHTCALSSRGAVKCWGDNAVGQLGYGDTTDIGDNETLDSVPFLDLGGTAVWIGAGDRHSCAILQTGALRCWGEGADGRLGTGSETDALQPMQTVDLGVDVAALSVVGGGSHTCARAAGGDVFCFGLNALGQLGYGPAQSEPVGDNESPASAGAVPWW